MADSINADTSWQFNQTESNTQRANLDIRYHPVAGGRSMLAGVSIVALSKQLDLSGQWQLSGKWWGRSIRLLDPRRQAFGATGRA